MPNVIDNLITKVPTDLCFNCNEFTKESFSVDQFLQDHRNKANLETMRDDLGIYLKVLRSAMIELINKDYADFVNLSSNLIGLDKVINGIQVPLGQLKEELLLVQKNIEDAMFEVSNKLERRRKIREKKRSLISLNRAHNSIHKLHSLLEQIHFLSPLILERIAAEYNLLKFNISRCQEDLTPSDRKNCEEIGQRVYSLLDQQFLKFQKEDKDSQLTRVLGIYVMLERITEAEHLYRKSVVSPAMNNLINEEALASNPRGLSGLYDTLINFVEQDMKVLLQFTQHKYKPPTVKGFDFLINSYWPEVEQRLELHLTSIYAPGNPDLFYQCYSETLHFLTKLEAKCDCPEAIRRLHQHSQYQSFKQRWNLPVYFQIRFQEIAGTFESVLVNYDFIDEDAEGWRLLVTQTAWQCIQRCWQDRVYISQLTHRFWKLSLQILSRYHVWTTEILNKKSEDGRLKINFWVGLYSDITLLVKKFDELFTLICGQLRPSVSTNTRELLKKSLDETKALLTSQLSLVSNKIVSYVTVESTTALRQVSEVPRLFRRTNRDTPTKALPYVAAMLSSPLEFHSNHKLNPHALQWLQNIFSDITKQYFTAVCDVLTSVQKTEESLRRLKKSRDRSSASGNANNERGGDDDKIRLQLYLDANSYYKAVENSGIKKENVEQLNDLLNLVETSHTKNGQK
uniref:Conserved oligomeric Golgi complex subunit 2 n=1 Tax=Clastoptera arizonana TaxID=38151 RepID=A0A1B6C3H8_9HEMI